MIGRFIRDLGARVPAPSRRVWRISREHPMGVYVEADAPLPMPTSVLPAQEPGRSWQTSSFDLLDGLQVSESPLDGLGDGGGEVGGAGGTVGTVGAVGDARGNDSVEPAP